MGLTNFENRETVTEKADWTNAVAAGYEATAEERNELAAKREARKARIAARREANGGKLPTGNALKISLTSANFIAEQEKLAAAETPEAPLA